MDGTPWKLGRGLLQGCSLSVAFTLALVSRWHFALGATLKTLSFVDDRIILAKDEETLQEGWQASQLWDRQHGWTVNTAKTVGFSVGVSFPLIPAGDTVLASERVFKYLGNEVHTHPKQARVVCVKRAAATRDTLAKISQLPKCLGINALTRLVDLEAIPQLTHGFQARPLPRDLIRPIISAVRRALWKGKKHMHAWTAAVLFCYNYHRIHPPVALAYTHIMSVIRALQGMDPDTLQDHARILEAPLLQQARGPMQTFLTQMLAAGFTRGHEWHIFNLGDKTYSLTEVNPKAFGHILREALRVRGLHDLSGQRDCFRDVATADLGVTARWFRAGPGEFTSGLLTLLCDGLWTRARRFRAQKAPTPECPVCDVAETVEHVLWHCPKWKRYRCNGLRDYQECVRDSPSARLCGVCHDFYPEGVKKTWNIYQRHLAALVQAYQQEELNPQNRTDVEGDGGGLLDADSGPNLPDALPPPIQDAWRVTGQSWDVPGQLCKERQGTRWPFATSALYQWQWYVAALRRPRATDQGHVPYASLIELYYSYLVMSGGVRFYTEVPDQCGGGTLCAQLDKFFRAIWAWQILANVDPLLAPRNQLAPITWQQSWGFPSSQSLAVKVILPGWKEARLAMQRDADKFSATPRHS